MTRFSFTTAGLFSLAIFTAMYLATFNVNAASIERRAGRTKQLYSFKFSYFNESDGETESGKTGFNYDGFLRPFGRISGGGGFDYEADTGYEGGINIGTTDPDNVNKTINGLGAGYRFNETNVDIGAGISAFDQKVNFQLDIAKDGTIFVHFDVQSNSTDLVCQPSDESDDSSSGIVCTATPNAS
ncbi:uncharacterized protein FA14DRAFT_183555 [Meira miltonrushii]|uniref:Uncharacterized protein n=1 Tax=Meira miltonrushii TaxID=1280837 RepID=A0A316VJ87_9BASI|nr:uncharacterized protein FA14DRAFT_183555 [Meira miltonrushii]PWN37616.1 hypothetical protein FA14DRAFT_183555 [Meira miltonrushii]